MKAEAELRARERTIAKEQERLRKQMEDDFEVINADDVAPDTPSPTPSQEVRALWCWIDPLQSNID